MVKNLDPFKPYAKSFLAEIGQVLLLMLQDLLKTYQEQNPVRGSASSPNKEEDIEKFLEETNRG